MDDDPLGHAAKASGRRLLRIAEAVSHSRMLGIALLVLCLPALARGWVGPAILFFFLGLLVLTGWSPLDLWWNGRTNPKLVHERDEKDRANVPQGDDDPER